MKTNSNVYIFIFSSVMVIVVAVLLSVTSTSLAPKQAKNVRIEKMQNILASIDVQSEPANAEQLFDQYLTEQLVLNTNGQPVNNNVVAFDIDLKKELDKAKTGNADKELFPLFIFNKDGKQYYVIPVRGKGLWGPIWGYIALQPDMNTIYGVSFGHKSETPGLGAEIATEGFQQKFESKKIFDEIGKYVSVKVLKGADASKNMHGVDALSGATVTSNGVAEMIERTLQNYVPYFKGAAKKQPTANN